MRRTLIAFAVLLVWIAGCAAPTSAPYRVDTRDLSPRRRRGRRRRGRRALRPLRSTHPAVRREGEAVRGLPLGQ